MDSRSILIFGLNMKKEQIMKLMTGFSEDLNDVVFKYDLDGKSQQTSDSLSLFENSNTFGSIPSSSISDFKYQIFSMIGLVDETNNCQFEVKIINIKT